MYSGISGQYDHQEHHTRFARVQYIPHSQWDSEPPLKPLWPMYLLGASVVLVTALITIF